MKKRICSLLLAVVMLLGMIPAVGAAQAIVQQGKCGDNLTWTLNDQGELRISGTGEMTNYELTWNGHDSTAPWCRVREQLKTLVLEPGITKIGEAAFYDCNGLTGKLCIPDTVTSIGWTAFNGCSGLTGNLVFPDSVTHIGGYAFAHCSGLTGSLKIPDGVTRFENCNFCCCSGLTSVELPETMTSIGWNAFKGCTNLTRVTIPKSVTSIKDHPFYECSNLKEVHYGGTEAEWQKLNYTFDHPVTMHYNSTGSTDPGVPDHTRKTVIGFIRNCDPFTEPATVKIDKTTYKVVPELLDTCVGFLHPENSAALESDKVVAFVDGDTIVQVEQLKNIKTELKVTMLAENEELSYGKTGFIFRKGFMPESIRVELRLENKANLPEREGYSTKEVLPYLETIKLFTPGVVENGIFTEQWDSSVYQIGGMQLKAGESVETALTLTPVKGYVPNQVREFVPFTVVVNKQKKTIDIPVGNLLLQEEQAQKNKADREKEEAAQNPHETTPEEYKKELKKTVKKYSNMDSTVILPQNLLSIMTNKEEKEKLTELVSFWITSIEFVPSMEWIEDAKEVEKIQKQLQKTMYNFFDVKIDTWNWLDKISHIFDSIQPGTKKSHITVQVSTKFGPQQITLYYQSIVQKFAQSSGELGELTWEPCEEGDAISKACINDFGVVTEYNIKEFNDDLLKMADKAIYHFYGKTAGAAIDEICGYVLNDFTKAVIKQICGSPSQGFYNLLTGSAKKAAIKCPVDVYVYDAGGVLRDSIIDNQVQTTQNDLFLYTVGDEKYVWMLGDDYHIRLVGTDTGTMTYEIEEYAGNPETPTRTVVFQNIPLGTNTAYTGDVPEAAFVEQQKYALTREGTGSVLLPTEDDYVPGHPAGAESVPVIKAVHGEFSGNKLYVTAEIQDKEQNVFLTELYYGLNEELSVAEMKQQSETMWTTTIEIPENVRSVHAIVRTSDISANNTVSDSLIFDRESEDAAPWLPAVPNEENKDSMNSSDVFSDVSPNVYYHGAVQWAVSEGIASGVDAYHFAPDAPCTRAQAVTFLWRAAGSPKPINNVSPFTDVRPEDYFHDAVLWAVENGITKGTSNTTFAPNSSCTRAHIVTFLWRSEYTPMVNVSNPFMDVREYDYFADAVLWAVKEGVTTGTSAETFSPDHLCTRAQVVTFLYRNEIK